MPGTIRVSACFNEESRHGILSITCSDTTSGSTLQTRNSYNGLPAMSRIRPNTSDGIARSPSTTPSNATTTTRCRFAVLSEERGLNPAEVVFLATGRSVFDLVRSCQREKKYGEHSAAANNELLGARYRSTGVRAGHVFGGRAAPEEPECRSRRWHLWRVPKRGIRPVGTALSDSCDAADLSRTSILPLHWTGVADACCVGSAPLLVGQSYLALYADLLLWVSDLRHPHRKLVLGRSALSRAARLRTETVAQSVQFRYPATLCHKGHRSGCGKSPPASFSRHFETGEAGAPGSGE